MGKCRELKLDTKPIKLRLIRVELSSGETEILITSHAAFFSTQTVNKPKANDKLSATANARLSSQLQYTLAVSRFAHYLKSIMRDKVGSFMTEKDAEDYLDRWICNYVLLDDEASQEFKARHPLREGRIDVSEIPGKPGVYQATVFLKPHYQLDELPIPLRLVTELPTPSLPHNE